MLASEYRNQIASEIEKAKASDSEGWESQSITVKEKEER